MNVEVRDHLNFLKNALAQNNITSDTVPSVIHGEMDGARVYKAADQVIANATWVGIQMDGEQFDSGYHDNAVNNTRLTVARTGYYLMGGTVEFASSATGIRVVALWRNGVNIGLQIAAHSEMSPSAGAGTRLTVSTLHAMNITDYVELGVYQSSGGNLSMTAVSDYSPSLWIVSAK